MATTGVQINGLRELGINLQRLKLEVRFKLSEAAARAGGAEFRKAAKRLAPESSESHQLGVRKSERVAPGNLKRNIFVLKVKKTDLTAEVEVRVRQGSGRAPKDAFYWLFLEFGTVKMAPRHFMRDAFAQAREPAAQRVAKALKLSIDKTVKNLPGKKK